jgi:hypothetical protein
MIILRIETPSGIGCYSSSAKQNAFRAHNFGGCALGVQHPAPEDDTDLFGHWADEFNVFHRAWDAIRYDEHETICEEYSRFGFASPTQYFAWFYTEDARRILQEAGYVVAVYSVPDDCVIHSSRQAVFALDKARVLTRLPCSAPLVEIETTYREAELGLIY